MSDQDAQQSYGTLDVESIMKEIRLDIQRRNLDGLLTQFKDVPNLSVQAGISNAEDYDHDKILEQMTNARAHYRVSWDHAIVGNPVTSMTKRFLRKLVRFYIFPIVVDQNSYNEDVINVLSQLVACVEEQQQLLEDQQVLINELMDKISDAPSSENVTVE